MASFWISTHPPHSISQVSSESLLGLEIPSRLSFPINLKVSGRLMRGSYKHLG